MVSQGDSEILRNARSTLALALFGLTWLLRVWIKEEWQLLESDIRRYGGIYVGT